MGTVIGALSTRGYGVSWRVLDAQYFGVAQRRRRVFIVGCLGDGERSSQILALSEGLSGNPKKIKRKRETTSATTGGSAAPSISVFGETGFAKYTENELKTLNATQHKRGTENVVVCKGD